MGPAQANQVYHASGWANWYQTYNTARRDVDEIRKLLTQFHIKVECVAYARDEVIDEDIYPLSFTAAAAVPTDRAP